MTSKEAGSGVRRRRFDSCLRHVEDIQRAVTPAPYTPGDIIEVITLDEGCVKARVVRIDPDGTFIIEPYTEETL